jgi:hypothetical protein
VPEVLKDISTEYGRFDEETFEISPKPGFQENLSQTSNEGDKKCSRGPLTTSRLKRISNLP